MLLRLLAEIFIRAVRMSWAHGLMTCNFNGIFRMPHFVFSAVFYYQFRLMCFSFWSILINDDRPKLIRGLSIPMI